MARLARLVVPGLPHLVTQRGSGPAPIFFGEADYAHYRAVLAAEAAANGVSVLGWCLMPDHVHMILVPAAGDALRRAIAVLNWRHAKYLNRHGGQGRHFRTRFGAVAMDARHLAAAYAYVDRNPVRKGLVTRAEDWPWSSARAHLGLAEDGVTIARDNPDFARLLAEPAEPAETGTLRAAETIGRPPVRPPSSPNSKPAPAASSPQNGGGGRRRRRPSGPNPRTVSLHRRLPAKHPHCPRRQA